MRIPALLPLFLLAVLALGPTAPASASAPVVAPEFANSFPALQPLQPAQESSDSGVLRAADEPLLLGAAYWLLLAAFAMRRSVRRTPEDDPTPITSWVLGNAPPVPR